MKDFSPSYRVHGRRLPTLLPESEIICGITFGEKKRSYEGGMRNHIWMDIFKKEMKNTPLLLF